MNSLVVVVDVVVGVQTNRKKWNCQVWSMKKTQFQHSLVFSKYTERCSLHHVDSFTLRISINCIRYTVIVVKSVHPNHQKTKQCGKCLFITTVFCKRHCENECRCMSPFYWKLKFLVIFSYLKRHLQLHRIYTPEKNENS